jgi:type IV pilus assembly protein PilO
MEEFLDQFNAYPLVQKIIGFGVVVAVLAAGFWFVLYSPLSTEIQSAESTLAEKVEKRQKLQQLKESQKKIKDRIEELESEIVVAEDKLPSSAQIPRLLKLLHEKAKTAGLEIQDFTRMTNNQKEYYVEIPVSMKLAGNYGELMSFFQFVERMNRIVNFKNLSLSRSDDNKGAAPGELVVDTTATTYRYKESN